MLPGEFVPVSLVPSDNYAERAKAAEAAEAAEADLLILLLGL